MKWAHNLLLLNLLFEDHEKRIGNLNTQINELEAKLATE